MQGAPFVLSRILLSVRSNIFRFAPEKQSQGGLDEFTALQAVTINAAKHIEVQDRVGSIEEGKDADFVLVKGSPFAVDTKILYTIIDGKVVYKNNSL